MAGSERTAVVVGGGIGGLAAAIALGHSGWQVTVLEQAAVFWEAGAGLLITPNGARALDILGVGDAVRAAGYPIRLAGVRSPDERWLVRLPEGEQSLMALGIHRRSLHAALVNAASEVAELVLGAVVRGVQIGDPRKKRARVSWSDADGEHTVKAHLVVAADGAGSTVRQLVVPTSHLDPSGLASWRAVIDDDSLVGADAVSWWGPGLEFGAQRIARDRVYWYAHLRRDDGVAFGDDLTEARRRVADWPAEVRAVVERTQPGQIVRHDLFEVGGVEGFVAGRTVLLGDASHAMLPTLAQGANLALEDAVTLARVLPPGLELQRGLADYDTLRRPRTQELAAKARRAANLGVGGRLGAAVAVLPDAWSARRARAIFDWQPPGA